MTESVCTNIVGQTTQLETTNKPIRHWHFTQVGTSLSDMFLEGTLTTCPILKILDIIKCVLLQWFCYKHKFDNSHAMPKSQKILLCAMNEAV